ncbi:MAG: oligopeptide/dipeptide ABC transporter ATP-binding protein, partial [Ferrovibrio sp.]
LFITHDLGVVAELGTRVLILYAGQIVEDAAIESVYRAPKHPYTAALFQSMPRLSLRGKPLPVISGRVPGFADMPGGCRFHDRCAYAQPGCMRKPELESYDDRRVRCFRARDLMLPGAL